MKLYDQISYLYQAFTRTHAITHTYILHITGFFPKHGYSRIRNHSRNGRLTYSFHTSCSDLDMVMTGTTFYDPAGLYP